MERLGLCMICGKPGKETCALCGKLVCADHFYPHARMCSHCIPPPERRHGDHRKGEPPLLMR